MNIYIALTRWLWHHQPWLHSWQEVVRQNHAAVQQEILCDKSNLSIKRLESFIIEGASVDLIFFVLQSSTIRSWTSSNDFCWMISLPRLMKAPRISPIPVSKKKELSIGHPNVPVARFYKQRFSACTENFHRFSENTLNWILITNIYIASDKLCV